MRSGRIARLTDARPIACTVTAYLPRPGATYERAEAVQTSEATSVGMIGCAWQHRNPFRHAVLHLGLELKLLQAKWRRGWAFEVGITGAVIAPTEGASYLVSSLTRGGLSTTNPLVQTPPSLGCS